MYTCTCIRTYIRTYYIHTCVLTYVPTCIHTYLPTYIHTYIHACTYVHVEGSSCVRVCFHVFSDASPCRCTPAYTSCFCCPSVAEERAEAAERVGTGYMQETVFNDSTAWVVGHLRYRVDCSGGVWFVCNSLQFNSSMLSAGSQNTVPTYFT